MKISIQGQLGSFHNIAQKQFRPGSVPITRTTFREVFNDVKSGEADYGIVAIENSLYGSINEVYDQLLHADLHIVGEVYLRIVHCLITLPGATQLDISDIYSMRPAIAQCDRWIDQHLPRADVHAMHDTAESVEFIKQQADRSKAAIASEEAAKLHQLPVLKKGIETNKMNYTRFIVLSQTPNDIDGGTKTSLTINLNGSLRAGALHNALGSFAERQINLCKIESRPIPGTHWEYMFYIDLEGSPSDATVQAGLNELKANGHQLTVLGSYPAGHMPQPD